MAPVRVVAALGKPAHALAEGTPVGEPAGGSSDAPRIAGDFDLALVTVRRERLGGVLPVLAASDRAAGRIPDILFMVNNPGGYGEIVSAVGAGRVLVGFPGAGGVKVGSVVRYALTPPLLQITTLGEPNGRITPRLRKIAGVLRRAGFSIVLSRDMEAWQKTHVALVSPIAEAIYMAGGSVKSLAARLEGIRLMLRAMREGFRALRAPRVAVTPAKLRAPEWAPLGLLVPPAAALFRTRLAEVTFEAHANTARAEMAMLADELRSMVRRSGPTRAGPRSAGIVHGRGRRALSDCYRRHARIAHIARASMTKAAPGPRAQGPASALAAGSPPLAMRDVAASRESEVKPSKGRRAKAQRAWFEARA